MSKTVTYAFCAGALSVVVLAVGARILRAVSATAAK